MFNKTLAQIKEACSNEAEKCKRESGLRYNNLYSRGRYLAFTVLNAEGREVAVYEGETWRWDGSLGDLKRAYAGAAKFGKVIRASIFGGFDYSDSLVAYTFRDDYDPLVAEWSVDIIE